jgi:hypothetical protein
MSKKRIELHETLKTLFGNDNVYYRPPENLKMSYPCIRYTRDNIRSLKADNISYRNTSRYTITVIDKKPDNEVIEKLLDLPMSSFDRHYESDNLNHDVIIIYY